jgi:hypothetical protein
MSSNPFTTSRRYIRLDDNSFFLNYWGYFHAIEGGCYRIIVTSDAYVTVVISKLAGWNRSGDFTRL